MSVGIPGLGVPNAGFDVPISRSLPTNKEPGFTDTLNDAMQQVEQLQGEAQTHVKNLLQGNGEDLHTTMIAVEKADVSFQLMMQVRNKIVSAYQEISRMQF